MSHEQNLLTVLHLVGAVGCGKTSILSSLLFHIAHGAGARFFREREAPSPRIEQQFRLLTKGRFFERTKPTEGADLDDRTAAREWVRLFRRDQLGNNGYPIDIVSEAGEEIEVLLRSGRVEDIKSLADRFARGEPRVLGVVFNPALMSNRTARTWFKALITHLCGLYLSKEENRTGTAPAVVPGNGKASLLRTTIETAAWVLFGLPAQSAQDDSNLHSIHPSVRGCFQNLPEDARMVCAFDEPDPDRRFRLESAALSAEESAEILKALDAVASAVTTSYLESMPTLRSLAEQAEQIILILTRFDLAHLLKSYLDVYRIKEECMSHVDREFPRHQVVEVDHLSLGFERDWRKAAADQKNSVWFDTLKMEQKNHALDTLVDAVDKEIGLIQVKAAPVTASAEAAPTYASNDNGGWDRVAEASWLTLRLAPLVLVAACVLSWMVSGRLDWDPLWRWLLGGSGFVVACWVMFLYSCVNGTPVWRINGNADNFDQRIFIDNLAPQFDARPEEISVRETFLSRLFDIAWVRHKGRQALLPSARRFLSLTGLEPAEAAMGSFLDASEILMLIGTFLIVVGSFVVS